MPFIAPISNKGHYILSLCGRADRHTIPTALPSLYNLLPLLASHAHCPLATLTVEQAAAVIKSACSIGGLLLQFLSYRRIPKQQ
jgi:hypothetical protein